MFTFSSQAQSWDAKSENAQFQIRVNNHTAYSSEIKKLAGLFTKSDFELIQNRCLTKEGVFRLDISQDKSTITVYYLDWIDNWTINWLITEASSELAHTFRFHSKTEFTF